MWPVGQSQEQNLPITHARDVRVPMTARLSPLVRWGKTDHIADGFPRESPLQACMH